MEEVFFASRSLADAYTCARRWYKFSNPVITAIGTTKYDRDDRIPDDVQDAFDAYLRALTEVGALTRRCPPNTIGSGRPGRPRDDEYAEKMHREYTHVLQLRDGRSAAIEFEVDERTAEWAGQCKPAGRTPAPAPYNAEGRPVVMVGRERADEREGSKSEATTGRRPRRATTRARSRRKG